MCFYTNFKITAQRVVVRFQEARLVLIVTDASTIISFPPTGTPLAGTLRVPWMEAESLGTAVEYRRRDDSSRSPRTPGTLCHRYMQPGTDYLRH